MARARNRRPISVAITPSAGQWQAFVTVGVKPDGKPDRAKRAVAFCFDCKSRPSRDCAARCYERCEDKVRELEDSLAAGEAPGVARDPWADEYFAAWLESRRDEIEHGTWKSYSTVVRLYLVPNVKGRRLRQFNSVANIKALLNTVKADVSAQAARKTLRTLRKALNDAVRDKLLTRSEAQFVQAPALDTLIDEVQPLSLAEVRALIPVIAARDDAARWLLALVHGPRQGEALGLRTSRPEERNPAVRALSDVDLDEGTFTVREKIARREWEHGCSDPHACGAKPRPHPTNAGEFLPPLHKLKPCPPDCKKHHRACPPPCSPNCTKHASSCPQRKNGGLVRGKPKTRKGARTVALEPVVLAAMRAYAERQEQRRQLVGSKWQETGYFFTDRFGKPISPEQDWRTFQAILDEAGLPPARVHALRHSAATFLLAAGVQKRVVMDLLGWSQDMTAVYQHPTDEMKRDAATAVGALLFAATGTDGSATRLLPDGAGNVVPFRRKAR